MYSSEQLERIFQDKDEVVAKITLLLDEYILLLPKLSEKAKEHCQYGICRRLLVIVECLEHFFTELPPDTNKERSRRENSLANIHLHAFLINISGIIDNMAWLWAYHIGLDTRFDLEKKKTMVGLFHKDYLEHLPKNIAVLVSEYSKWQEFMINHRHPTAHRIPPYIIPYTNSDKNDLPSSRNYTPRYIHSFSSKYGPIPLHAQSLADANTIRSLLDALLIELR